MRKQRLSIVVCILLSVAGCRNATTGPANTRGGNATVTNSESAIPGCDTPLKALRRFFDGIVDGDRNKSASATIANEDVLEYIDANIRVVESIDAFAKTDNEYFGVEGAMPVGMIAKSLTESVDNAQIEMIDDSHARWSQNPSNPLVFRKTKDGWKIDFTGPQSANYLKMATRVFTDTARMYDEVRQSILDGEIKTRDGARKKMARLTREYGL